MAGNIYSSPDLWNESVSAVTASNTVALGSRRWNKGTEYVYVYNNGTTAAVGYGVIATATSAYSVTVTSALGSRFFGIVQNASLTTNYYGWVAVQGPVASLAMDATTVTALTGMCLQAGVEGLCTPVTTGATGSTFALRGMFGYCLGEIATSATGPGYVKCWG